LARGESTFLTEMLETAAILNSATERSLVIMDEVGRGTGTRDGLAIARAVSEYLLNTVRCRTLFATHYHELAAIEHSRLANRSLLVEESDGEILFRRRLVEGAAAESYGIHVAQLAGVPEAVLRRAEQIMLELKSGEKKAPETPAKTDTLHDEENAAGNSQDVSPPMPREVERSGLSEKNTEIPLDKPPRAPEPAKQRKTTAKKTETRKEISAPTYLQANCFLISIFKTNWNAAHRAKRGELRSFAERNSTPSC
jgi:DNA mismatch repair ATPase MutS